MIREFFASSSKPIYGVAPGLSSKIQDLGTIRSVLLACPGAAGPSESRRHEGELQQSSLFIKTELLGPLELPDGSAPLAVQSPPCYPDHDKLSRNRKSPF